MTQDEIIRMAYAAGAVKAEHTVLDHQWFEFTSEQLKRFAVLVAEETCKDLEKELLALRNKVVGIPDYVQGRWDLVGEMQDIIIAKGKP